MLLERVNADIGMFIVMSLIKREHKQDDGKSHCRRYLIATKPIVMLAIHEDENHAQKEHAPKHASYIVDVIERNERSLAEMPAQTKMDYEEKQQ